MVIHLMSASSGDAGSGRCCRRGVPHPPPRAEGLDCRVNASVFTEQGSCCLDPVKGLSVRKSEWVYEGPGMPRVG